MIFVYGTLIWHLDGIFYVMVIPGKEMLRSSSIMNSGVFSLWSLWKGWDTIWMPWFLPVMWCCLEKQQQQLPARDNELTAPWQTEKRTSLVLVEVSALCCLICLKMTVSSHLKQRQVGIVSYVKQWWWHGVRQDIFKWALLSAHPFFLESPARWGPLSLTLKSYL